MPQVSVGVQGLVTLVDQEDFEAVTQFRWSKADRGRTTYAVRWQSSEGRRHPIYLHSYITGWARVDHINHDGLDNRRRNLRLASHQQNMRNRRALRGFKGVRRRWNRWEAYCGVHGDYGYLGRYDTAEAAARAYDDRAVELYGEWACLNFPRTDDGQ